MLNKCFTTSKCVLNTIPSLNQTHSIKNTNSTGSFNWAIQLSIYLCLPWLLFVVIHTFLASSMMHTSISLMSKSEHWTAIVMFPTKFLPALNMLFPFLMWDCLPICCFSFGFFQLCLKCYESIFMESLSINTSFSIYFTMCNVFDTSITSCFSKLRFQLAVNSSCSEILFTKLYVVS